MTLPQGIGKAGQEIPGALERYLLQGTPIAACFEFTAMKKRILHIFLSDELFITY